MLNGFEALCRAIVSTYEGSIPEIVEHQHNGLLTAARSPIALAEQLVKLLTNPDLRITMGINGRYKFDQLYAIEKFENRMAEILKQLNEQVDGR